MKVDGNRFRRARFQRFLQAAEGCGSSPTLRILDIGGTVSYWRSMSDLWDGRDWIITIVNLSSPERDDGRFRVREGDACALPQYQDNSFDIVHSNSVIEHVGRWPQMVAMADEVRRLAPAYFIQTPDFWFPVEPHYRTAFFHWCPEIVRAKMLMRKRRGFRGPEPSMDAAMRNIQDVNLLSASQLGALFPDASISHERVFGLSKSITAIRGFHTDSGTLT